MQVNVTAGDGNIVIEERALIFFKQIAPFNGHSSY